MALGITLYGKDFTIVQQGTGPNRPLIDFLSVSLAEGTILEDEGNRQLWIVQGGAADVSTPGVKYNFMVGYTGAAPAPSQYNWFPQTVAISAPPVQTQPPPPPVVQPQPQPAPPVVQTQPLPPPGPATMETTEGVPIPNWFDGELLPGINNKVLAIGAAIAAYIFSGRK